DQLRPALGYALSRGRVADAIDDQPPVCPGPAAGVFAVAPIEEIVTALLTGSGMIGNLIRRQPRRTRQLLRGFEQRQCLLALGHSELARGMQGGERRLRLDGELVEREVTACEGEGPAKLAPPILDGLARARVDEVEGHAVEMRVRDLQRRDGFVGRVD